MANYSMGGRRMGTPTKVILGLVVLCPGLPTVKSVVPDKVELPTASAVTQSAPAVKVEPIDFPSTTVLPGEPDFIWQLYAWQAHNGMFFSNGGPMTTKGSLMAKYGVKLKLIRQDDVPPMQAGLVACAEALSKGKKPGKDDICITSIMGDGAGYFLHDVNAQLEKLGGECAGNQCIAEIIGSCGFSRGEDKFMGLPEWKLDPQKACGSLILGVLRDGDWNIALKWAGDNGIPNNPDETTYDPDAMNWVNAPSYTKAAEWYNTPGEGYCEDRDLVKNGVRVGKKVHVCANGVVTWTPGDVTVKNGRGGLVSIASTYEYYWQMPNVIITVKKFAKQNEDKIVGMLRAIFEGGDQLKSNPAALKKATEIAAVVWKEETPDYWLKYFYRTTETDKFGNRVELGGSSVNNLADNMQLFGLVPGGLNFFKITYESFGSLVVQQYPKLLPGYPPINEIFNTSYIQRVASTSTSTMPAELPTFNEAAPMAQLVSKKSWAITFKTGSAEFTPDAVKVLGEMLQQVAIAGNLLVEVHGHTDDVGDAGANYLLSKKRADAVKSWLQQQSATNFPDARVRVFAHGEDDPVTPTTTAEARAQNRRVEIILGVQ